MVELAGAPRPTPFGASPDVTMFRHAAILASLTLLSACAVYTPVPIDLARDTEQWRAVSAELCPEDRTLNREEIQHIGLMLNPALNEARLTAARSTAVAEFAGLWDDPSLSGDLKRVLPEAMTNREVGLSLAIPLTGIPSLTRKAAEQYREADFWTVKEKERAYLEGLDLLCTNILLTHTRLIFKQRRLAELRDERDRIAKLYELGEVTFSAYQMANQRLNDTINAEQELESTHLSQHMELNSMLGLHPDFRKVEIDEPLPKGIPAAKPIPTPADLLQNPALRAQLASYGGTEKELQAEIRRQYPQLSLGSGYGYEDGNDKLGVGFELSIPLWNRNREAIARATGDRALKQAETLTLWKKLLQQADILKDRQELALHHCRAERERVDTLLEAVERQAKLYELGESSLLELAEVRHEAYQRRMGYFDCLSELMDIRIKLRHLAKTQ